MFKIILRHFAYEKAIDVLFHRIFKNFPIKPKHYSKVFVRNNDELDETILVVMYNVQLCKVPDEPEMYTVQFEYFKYCDSGEEYNWEHEINMSSPVKPPKVHDWFEINKNQIIKKIS